MGAGRCAALLAGVALLGAGGCSTPKAPLPVGNLSPEDRDLAQALAHFAQGLVYEWQEQPDPEAALEAYQAALRSDPSDPDLRPMAARLLLQLSRPEEALALLEKAALDFPGSFEIRQSLARIALLCNRFDIAAREFSAAFDRATSGKARRETLRMAAFALFRQERDPEARATLSRLAALTDADATERPGEEEAEEPAPPVRDEALQAALELADLRLDQATGADSAAAYAAWAADLAEGDESQADVWETFAAAALRKKQPDLALDAFRRSAALDPLRTRVVIAAVALQAKIASRQVTLDMLLERLRAGETDPALALAAARLLATRDRHAEAIPHAAAAAAAWTAANPGRTRSPGFWLFQGSLLERAGRRDEAERLFREALAQHPAHAPMLNYLAYMLAEQNRLLDEAEQLVRAALAVEPENSAYLDTLGWIFFQQGRPEEALVWLLRAAEDEPRDAVIFDHLGDTLARLNRRAEAVSYWTMSLHLDPSQQAVRAKLETAGARPAPDPSTAPDPPDP